MITNFFAMKKIFTLLFLMVSITAFSQEEEKFKPTMKFKGFTQMFFSATDYPDEPPYGFSLRRLRIVPHGNLTKNITYLIQFAFDKQAASIKDARVNFKIADQFQVMAGQFAAPGARSGALVDSRWSTTKMNLIQRSMVTQNFGTYMKQNAYRDVGVQFHGFLLDKKLYYATMLANPSGKDLYSPSVKSPEYSHSPNGLKSWTRLEVYPVPEMGIGGFVGINNYTDTIDNLDNAFGAHVLYRKNLRLFSEFVYGENTAVSDYLTDFKYMGYYFELGYVFDKIMPIVGIDRYHPVIDGSDKFNVENYTNLTIGVNYYFSKNVKGMANYIARFEKMDEASGADDLINNLFVFGVQIYYKQAEKKK